MLCALDSSPFWTYSDAMSGDSDSDSDSEYMPGASDEDYSEDDSDCSGDSEIDYDSDDQLLDDNEPCVESGWVFMSDERVLLRAGG